MERILECGCVLKGNLITFCDVHIKTGIDLTRDTNILRETYQQVGIEQKQKGVRI